MASSQQAKTEELHAVIDMGSNGIRFSITDLSFPTTRVLPTVFQDRCGISLFDAQYRHGSKIPIPDQTIEEILQALASFKRTCGDFAVQRANIQLVATEATRNAINSTDFLRRIEYEIGWKPRLLSKEDEGRLGAMGIASSVNGAVDGLVMDMGGGSVQLTWMEKDEAGRIDLSCFQSLPYGAAALMARLPHANPHENSSPLEENVSSDLKAYFAELRTRKPAAMAKAIMKGMPVYLSGGGFRSWGHILMTIAPDQPYPIPIVNGLVVEGRHLLPDLADHQFTTESHRISSRRSSQIPAIKFLLTAILGSLGDLSFGKATFCQGGVREGLLYGNLPETLRACDALTVATMPFAPPSASILNKLLSSTLPDHGRYRSLVPSVVNFLYHFDSYPKDIRAAAALRSTTTGVLANIHGISHHERTSLALILCERWGGEDDVPFSDRNFLHSLEKLENPACSWWIRYLGCMANGIAKIYPSGLVHEPLIRVKAEGVDTLMIQISPLKKDVISLAQHWAKQVKKLGKRKTKNALKTSDLGMNLAVDIVLDNVSAP